MHPRTQTQAILAQLWECGKEVLKTRGQEDLEEREGEPPSVLTCEAGIRTPCPQGCYAGVMRQPCESSAQTVWALTLPHLYVHQAEQDFRALSPPVAAGWWDQQPQRKNPLSAVSLVQGTSMSIPDISLGEPPTPLATTLGVGVFHPVATTTPNTILLLKWFPLPPSLPPPSDLWLPESPFPYNPSGFPTSACREGGRLFVALLTVSMEIMTILQRLWSHITADWTRRCDLKEEIHLESNINQVLGDNE